MPPLATPIGPISVMAPSPISARHQVATMCDHEGMLLDNLSRVACIPGGVSNALHDASLGITLRASFKGPVF